MIIIFILISAFAFERLSNDLKNSIAKDLEPFSALKMVSVSPKMRKIGVFEIVKVPRGFYSFEVFRNAEGFCAADKNGRLENIDFQKVNKLGEGLVHIASREGHTEVVRLLAEACADLNKACELGRTPVYVAALHGQKVVQVLAEYGADLNKADESEWTSVCAAASNGHTEIVTFLAGQGVNLNRATNYGRTPVHYASAKGHAEVVEILAAHGANVSKADDFGDTPIFIAASNGCTEVVRVLIESKAKLDKKLLNTEQTAEIEQLIQNALEKKPTNDELLI